VLRNHAYITMNPYEAISHFILPYLVCNQIKRAIHCFISAQLLVCAFKTHLWFLALVNFSAQLVDKITL